MSLPKYISAEQYSKQTGLGVEEVKRQCRLGNIQCLMTEGGYYKIPVYENSVVSKEEYDKIKTECEMYKTMIKQINLQTQIN